MHPGRQWRRHNASAPSLNRKDAIGQIVQREVGIGRICAFHPGTFQVPVMSVHSRSGLRRAGFQGRAASKAGRLRHRVSISVNRSNAGQIAPPAMGIVHLRHKAKVRPDPAHHRKQIGRTFGQERSPRTPQTPAPSSHSSTRTTSSWLCPILFQPVADHLQVVDGMNFAVAITNAAALTLARADTGSDGQHRGGAGMNAASTQSRMAIDCRQCRAIVQNQRRHTLPPGSAAHSNPGRAARPRQGRPARCR